MKKQSWTWTSRHLPAAARMVRWGHFGAPVLIFPTAGGDFEEIERFKLVGALGALIDGGRIKVYSLDGIAVRAWLSGTQSAQACLQLQGAYDSFVFEDVLERIREDCQDPRIEPILAGASLGAFFALNGICRHPEAFRLAIGLSGVYDLACELGGVSSDGTDACPPIEYLSRLSGSQLEQLRRRKVILGCGQGDYETPLASQKMAAALASKAVPCRLSLWGPARDHAWSTWCAMLPGLLAKQL
jgi:esterase/lipase superfamily enzyme